MAEALQPLDSEPLAPLDPFDENLEPLAELAKRLPRRPSPSILSRWIHAGRAGTKLRTLLICGQHYTTADELKRFVSAIQPKPTAPTDEHLDAVDRSLRNAGFETGGDPRGNPRPPVRRSRRVESVPA